MSDRKRPGRPRKRSQETAGDYVGFRIPRAVKEQLSAAAEASGRSLSTEAQFRIEWSFREQGLALDALDLAYGRQGAGLLMLLGRCIGAVRSSDVSALGGDPEVIENWMDRPWTAFQVADAVRYALSTLTPRDLPAPPATLDKLTESLSPEGKSLHELAGQRIAHHLINFLINPSAHHAFGPALQPIRERLGGPIETLKGKIHAG